MHCGWYYTSVYEIQNTYSQNSWGAKREKIMVTAPILELKSLSSTNELGLGWTELCNDSTYAFSIPLWPLLLLCKVIVRLKQKLPDRAIAMSGSGAGNRLSLQDWHSDGLHPVAAREGSIAHGTRSHTGAASCRGQWHPHVPYPQGGPCGDIAGMFCSEFVWKLAFLQLFFFYFKK